ncbi:hypothetical protein [Niabella beijingensis]|uniref:hypothetical protein n=1 Tax=Niabella beijingensis TaxID=2872700 RepID=UPI001CBD8901|nr:hypothetical protein [Niabella beijingensis]MBZ4190126.1 hypothetical protein [Niabella beijingensis]
MKKHPLLLKCLVGMLPVLFLLQATAQTKVLLKIPANGATTTAFIPEGYDTISVVYGDLNKDGQDDVAMALNAFDEGRYDTDEGLPRLLIILLKTPAGYQLAGRSQEVLMCRACGGVMGDPFASISITNGILSVDHYGGSAWRWAETEKFRYQNNAFYQIGSTYDNFFIGRECEDGIGDAGRKMKDINWVTGDQHIIERNDDCSLVKDKREKIKKKPLVKLEAYKR